MLDEALESAIRARFRSARFSRWMGLELSSLGDGSSEVRLRLEPHHLNPGGIAHGGVVASILDVAIGLALRTRLGMDSAHVTMQLHVNYMRPVSGGDVVARGRAVRTGQRVTFGEADLLTPAGDLLARADATFLVVPKSDDEQRV